MRTMPHAPLPLPLPSVLLVPPYAHRASLFHAGPRTPFPLPAVVVSQHAWRLSFSFSGFPPFSWPAVLSFYLLRIAPRATTPARMHARSLAHTPTTFTTDERRDVRSAGVADWKNCTTGQHGARAHRCGGPLSLRPQSPCPYNAAVPEGPAF